MEGLDILQGAWLLGRGGTRTFVLVLHLCARPVLITLDVFKAGFWGLRQTFLLNFDACL